MAIQATIKNIADNAWPLVKPFSAGGTPLNTHLGKDAATIVAQHFPLNWLSSIKVKAASVMPTPDLSKLVTKMKYRSEAEFKKACDSTDRNLFVAVKGFSSGGGSFYGIAYDKTIYLRSDLQHSLDLVVHELVHTLQWAKYKPEEFLRRYIQGYVKANLVYRNNPAEAVAYKFEKRFRDAVNGVLMKNKRGPLPDYGFSITKLAPKAPVSSAGILTSLKGVKSLNITKTSATAEMYSL